uniref:ST3 beta-galactoside alpha-2,3-sialyltransferase 4 n=1 Tax=Callorhinchus milii TaxID=7868 RepID=A0A4W3GX01_CALMI
MKGQVLVQLPVCICCRVQYETCLTDHSNLGNSLDIANFTKNTRLFLTLEDAWWKPQGKATHELPYGVKGTEKFMVKILARIQYHMPENIHRLPCKTCVVIGNGYNLKNSSLGDVIDKYDIVFRLNDAPVRGYEKDVGSKTTIRLFYPESAVVDPSIENTPDTLLVFLLFKPADARWLMETLYNEKRLRKGFWKAPPLLWHGDPTKTRVLNPYYPHQAATKLLHVPLNVPPKSKKKIVHPTTGFIAVTVALNYCDEVHIAGFGYPLNQNNFPIHYYSKTTMKEMAVSTRETQTLGLLMCVVDHDLATLLLKLNEVVRRGFGKSWRESQRKELGLFGSKKV